MKFGNSKPPSRLGKKQIIAYIDTRLANQIRNRASVKEQTKQETVAEAINFMLEQNGRPSILGGGHQRIVKRRKSIAQARTNDSTPSCRSGKQAICGWFDQGEVAEVRKIAKDLDHTVQSLLEEGLRQLLSTDGLKQAS